MRVFLIPVSEKASLSELPHRQQSCCSAHLSLALASTADDPEAEATSWGVFLPAAGSACDPLTRRPAFPGATARRHIKGSMGPWEEAVLSHPWATGHRTTNGVLPRRFITLLEGYPPQIHQKDQRVTASAQGQSFVKGPRNQMQKEEPETTAPGPIWNTDT